MHEGNGKRWLLIGGLILGGFWLANSSYQDGFSDALVRSGKVTAVAPVHYYAGGGGFPWGLLIIGGIIYFAYRKGFFGGPGRHGNGRGNGNGQVQRYGAGYGGYNPAQDPRQGQQGQGQQNWGGGFRGPRDLFEDWHRQAHEAPSQAQPAAPAAPATGYDAAQGGYAQAPQAHPQTPAQTAPPPPPTPEYWATMAPAADAPAAPPTAPEARGPEAGASTPGATGSAL